MKRYIKATHRKEPQMRKNEFIKSVLQDARSLRNNKNNPTRWFDTAYVVSKDGTMRERWQYELYNDPVTNKFLTKFIVDDEQLGHTVYDWTNWVDHGHKYDSDIKEFLEREIGKSFIRNDEVIE